MRALQYRWRAVTLFFFFFNDPAPTEIYTLSLHDALPILGPACASRRLPCSTNCCGLRPFLLCPSHRIAATVRAAREDRKSTRLNSSHVEISYAVFCLKKKKRSTGSGRQGFCGHCGIRGRT